MTKAAENRMRTEYWDFVAKLPCVLCFDRFYEWLLCQEPEVYVNLLLMVQELTDTAPEIQRSRTGSSAHGKVRQPARAFPEVSVARGVAALRWPPSGVQKFPSCRHCHVLAEELAI